MGVSLGSAFGSIVIGTDEAQANVQSLSQQLRSVGTTMSLAISAPLLAVGGAALKSASGFEQSLNIMQQVSGATAEQMAALEAQALDLGATTSFSAGDAADAMLELAKAGMSTEQVGAAIAGVMDLAAAGGLGLADAATITANAINAFGLDASDATGVANTFAAAANASSADVSDLAQGFQMAGAVFASNGQTVDDLAASLAILANNGIAGSDAGTSLKTMMMRLAAPTDEAAAQIASLGLSVYDAQGAMLPFGEIVGSLESATQGMSDAQRNAALSTIFGADAIRAATILAGEGSTTFDKMRGAVQQQGAAAQVAGARMAGFRGAIEYLKGSIDSFLIGTALPFLDMGGSLLRWVGDAITGFGNLSEPVKNAALAFAAVLAAAGPVMLAISGIVAVIAALTSPIGLVVVALAGLAAAWAADFGGIQEKTAAAWVAIQPYLAQAWAWFQSVLPGALAALQSGFSTAWTAVSSAVSTAWGVIGPYLARAWAWMQATLPGALAALQSGFSTAWTAISGAVSTAWTAIQTTWTTIQTWLQTNLPTAVSGLQSAWASAWPAIQSAVNTAWTAIQTTWTTIQTWLQTNLPTAVSGLQTAWATAWPAMQSAVDTAWTGMQTGFTTLQTALATGLPGALTTMQTAFSTAIASITAIWNSVAALFAPAIERVQTAFAGLGTSFSGMGPALSGLQTAFGSLGTALGALWTAIQPLVGQLVALFAGTLGVVALTAINGFAAAIQAIGPILTTLTNQVAVVVQFIAAVLSGLVAGVQALVQGDWAGAWAAAGTIVDEFKTFVSSTFGNLLQLVAAIWEVIKNTVVSTLTDLGVDAQGIMEGIRSWWEQKWNALTGYLQPVIDMVERVKNALQGFADWIGGLSIPNPFSPLIDSFNWLRNNAGSFIPGLAVGTSFAPSGLVEVGERGREFIIPPAGSKVLTNGQSNRLAANSGAVVNNYITMPGARFSSDRDEEQIAYRLAGKIATAAANW